MKIVTYELLLDEPVRIVDAERGKPDETACMSYIPGTTIRGMILSRFRTELDMDEKLRRGLLGGKTRFSNAYPLVDAGRLYPSPMGFYESKLSNGTVENILAKEDPTPGYKRAGLGEFALIDGNTIRYMSVAKKDMLGIQVSGKRIFRSVVLTQGQIFGGYIIAEEDEQADRIRTRLQGDFKIGSSGTTGLGACHISSVLVLDPKDMSNEFLAVEAENVRSVTMILRSPMTMRNGLGEICGVDEDGLSEIFGTKVTVGKMATSVVKISGVNRTWRVRTPEITMYKAGSVFALEFAESVSREKLLQISLCGIGVNTAEGCGMVAFMDSFDAVDRKEELLKTLPRMSGVRNCGREDVESVRKFAARSILRRKIRDRAGKYIVENADKVVGGIGKSQMGIVLNWAKNMEYMGASSDELEKFIAHEKEKQEKEKRQTESGNGKDVMLALLEDYKDRELFEIIGLDDQEVMGYPSSELLTYDELLQMKYDILFRMITYYRRKGKVG